MTELHNRAVDDDQTSVHRGVQRGGWGFGVEHVRRCAHDLGYEPAIVGGSDEQERTSVPVEVRRPCGERPLEAARQWHGSGDRRIPAQVLHRQRDRKLDQREGVPGGLLQEASPHAGVESR